MKAMRTLGRLAVAALAVSGLTACPPTPPPTAVPSRPTPLDAMLSVHANALWVGSRFPEGVKVMSLPDAAHLLHDDDSRLGLSRKRRAIARLAGYGFDGEKFETRLREGIRILLDSPQAVEALEEKIQDFARRPCFHSMPTPGEIETFFADEYVGLSSLCPWWDLEQ